MDIATFQQFQRLPYESKVSHAVHMAKDFYKTITSPVGEYYANCYVSVGGLDSITLMKEREGFFSCVILSVIVIVLSVLCFHHLYPP